MSLRISGLLATILLLAGCGGNDAQMVGIQSNTALLQSLSKRVAQLEAEQQAISAQVASSGIRVPTGITAVPAQRRSGVYDDQPIRAAADTTVDEFEQAMSLYRAGDIDRATAAFEQYINRGGNGQIDNVNLARYWLGDAYYNQRQFDKASRYLGQYLRDMPNGEKAGPALDKLIQSLRASGRGNDADLLRQYGVQAIIGSQP